MKQFHLLSLLLVLLLILPLWLTGCGFLQGNTEEGSETVKETPIYTSDAVLGTGAKRVVLLYEDRDLKFRITLNTDREFLADALKDEHLVSGIESQYGLYILEFNGITADYPLNKSYWSLTKGGEMLPAGADTMPISDGDVFEITRVYPGKQ